LGKHSILIVEDNAVNVKLFRVLLEKAGFVVRTAGDATQAMEALSEALPEVILMDVQLPDIDGLELTRRLRKDPRFKNIPVVALTAYAMKGDKERALDAGCQGYIPKPIDTRAFASQVLQFCVESAEGKESPAERKLLLIADDDAAQLELLGNKLTALGFEVIATHDGAEAIEQMHRRCPALVVSDILMPRLDGFRLTQFVRHEPAFVSVPVVLMTAGAIRQEDVDLARNLGANALVPKTPSFDKAVQAIQSALVEGAVTLTTGDNEGFEELRKRFVVDGMCDLAALLDSADPGVDYNTAEQLLHRWAGTGGTVGLPQVSKVASEAEGLLRSESAKSEVVLSKLRELNELFSTVRSQTDTVSDVVGASLSGKRFAAIGFSDAEANHLRETLEHAHAILRIVYVDSGLATKLEGDYDAILLNVTGDPYSPAIADLVSTSSLPVIGVGSSSSVIEGTLALGNAQRDFLLRPWIPSDLILRCYTVLMRSASRQNSVTRTPRVTANVLIGDDDSTTVALLQSTLRTQNVNCHAASSSHGVMEAVRRERPDLLVLDVNVPELDGFKLLKTLKTNEETRDIPVVLLTAQQQESDILRGFSLGAQDYVAKPFSPMELAARIKKTLRLTA